MTSNYFPCVDLPPLQPHFIVELADILGSAVTTQQINLRSWRQIHRGDGSAVTTEGAGVDLDESGEGGAAGGRGGAILDATDSKASEQTVTGGTILSKPSEPGAGAPPGGGSGSASARAGSKDADAGFVMDVRDKVQCLVGRTWKTGKVRKV